MVWVHQRLYAGYRKQMHHWGVEERISHSWSQVLTMSKRAANTHTHCYVWCLYTLFSTFDARKRTSLAQIHDQGDAARSCFSLLDVVMMCRSVYTLRYMAGLVQPPFAFRDLSALGNLQVMTLFALRCVLHRSPSRDIHR